MSTSYERRHGRKDVTTSPCPMSHRKSRKRTNRRQAEASRRSRPSLRSTGRESGAFDWRRKSSWREPLADIRGRAVATAPYRRNGKLAVRPLPECPTQSATHADTASAVAERDLSRQRRRLSALLARWRRAGVSAKQMEVIEHLLLRGRSQGACAALLGVTPAAISDRIHHLRRIAPEFYRWWRRHGSLGERFDLLGETDFKMR
jgi:hypothetical protein